MGRTKRTIRNLGLAGGAGLLAAALVVPSAGAATSINVNKEVNQVAGSASGKALDLSVLGRGFTLASTNVSGAVDNVANTLDLTADALGSALSPATHVTGVLNGGEKKGCASAPIAQLLGQIKSTLASTPLADALPSLTADIACGTANITGALTGFESKGTGQVADIKVALAPAVQQLIGQVHNTINSTIAATPVNDVLKSTDAAAVNAIGQINTLLSSQLGLGVQLPVVAPTTTVNDLLTQLANADLARISIGKSIARQVGDAASYASIAHDDAGMIEILPEFRGPGTPALVTIKVAQSEASVNVVRDTAAATGSATNTVVRIESELLPTLDFGRIGLPGVLSAADLAAQFGLKTGQGFIEVSPGQDLTLFAGTPLESSIAVSKVTKPEVLENGHLKVTAATASIHLFKGLDNLIPGVQLGTILGSDTVTGLLTTLNNTLAATPLKDLVGGLVAGPATGIPGIKLDFAKAEAEAGAVKVKPTPLPQVAATQVTKLPRTGGPELAVPAAMLLGSAGGLRVMMRRRRRA